MIIMAIGHIIITGIIKLVFQEDTEANLIEMCGQYRMEIWGKAGAILMEMKEKDGIQGNSK